MLRNTTQHREAQGNTRQGEGFKVYKLMQGMEGQGRAGISSA